MVTQFISSLVSIKHREGGSPVGTTTHDLQQREGGYPEGTAYHITMI